MQFDRASKQITASFGEAKRFAIYLPFFGVVFGVGVAWATAKADLGSKADAVQVKTVDDSLGRQIAYQAGLIDKLTGTLQTLADNALLDRQDQRATLVLLCENFPASQTRLVQLRCAAK